MLHCHHAVSVVTVRRFEIVSGAFGHLQKKCRLENVDFLRIRFCLFACFFSGSKFPSKTLQASVEAKVYFFTSDDKIAKYDQFCTGLNAYIQVSCPYLIDHLSVKFKLDSGELNSFLFFATSFLVNGNIIVVSTEQARRLSVRFINFVLCFPASYVPYLTEIFIVRN